MTEQDSTDGRHDSDKGAVRRGVIRLLVVALVLGGAYAAYTTYQKSKAAFVGDCVTSEDSRGDYSEGHKSRRGRGIGSRYGPKKVDCTDPTAQYVVLDEFPTQTAVPPEEKRWCMDVDGAVAETATNRSGDRTLCLGEIGADPARSANTIAEGECMIPEAEDPRRADCGEPGAMRVVAVLEDFTSISEASMTGTIRECREAGAPEAETGFTWGLRGKDDQRAVCLVPAGDGR